MGRLLATCAINQRWLASIAPLAAFRPLYNGMYTVSNKAAYSAGVMPAHAEAIRSRAVGSVQACRGCVIPELSR